MVLELGVEEVYEACRNSLSAALCCIEQAVSELSRTGST